MSKNKVKIESTEVSYDVTRASGFVLEGAPQSEHFASFFYDDVINDGHHLKPIAS